MERRAHCRRSVRHFFLEQIRLRAPRFWHSAADGGPHSPRCPASAPLPGIRPNLEPWRIPHRYYPHPERPVMETARPSVMAVPCLSPVGPLASAVSLRFSSPPGLRFWSRSPGTPGGSTSSASACWRSIHSCTWWRWRPTCRPKRGRTRRNPRCVSSPGRWESWSTTPTLATKGCRPGRLGSHPAGAAHQRPRGRAADRGAIPSMVARGRGACLKSDPAPAWGYAYGRGIFNQKARRRRVQRRPAR
jgi:hypothetical protein